MDDSPYRVEPWNAGDALVGIVGNDERRSVVRAADDMRAACQPCDRAWLKKRLAAMALAFGHERDPDRAAAWLAETGRLLLDLPGDILATAIDEAIKRSDRGFMPAVGQIRAIADPMMAQRRQQSSRLEAMAGIIDRRSRKVMSGGWDAPAVERPQPDADRVPAGEIDAFNRNMRKFGCSIRCGRDGVTFELEDGAADPTMPVTAGAS